MALNLDSFVNRIRQTVSDVAHQVNSSVNTIIPGNLIHREYRTIRLRCTHGCPGLVWNVYDAVKRDSSSIKASIKDAIGPNTPIAKHIISPDQDILDDEKQIYSVFIFDKSQLDNIPNRAERETVLDHLKKGVTQLTRLRHPAILTVHHPLEESRSSLAFITEHVHGHLESILRTQRIKKTSSAKCGPGGLDNLVDLSQDLGPKDEEYSNDSCQLDDVQIKAGLLQICDGLKFLHNDAKMLHRNICLDNIFVDTNNSWKIGGFEFSCSATSTINEVPKVVDSELQIMDFASPAHQGPTFQSLRNLKSKLPSVITPNWSFSAPEHSSADYVSYPADIFSLGVLSCALLGPNLETIDLSYEYGTNSDSYKRGIRFRELADRLPTSFKNSVMKFAAINVDSRPSLDHYQNLPLFNDPHVMAIRNLDTRYTWDRLRKIDFFNHLRDILPQLSHQIKVNRVAKSLFNEIMNSDMLPYILPCILIISKDSTPTEFKSKIFPNLKGPFRVLEPKAVPLMLLDNLDILADRAKLCLREFQQSAFTLIHYLLKMDQQLQEKSLLILPKVKKFIDNESKTKLILPELKRLCHETNSLAIRVKCLDCIDRLIDVTDEPIVLDQILPIVFDIPSREAEVVMAATRIIKTIVNDLRIELTKENIAGKILPFMIPLSVEKELNLQQFDLIMSLIKNLLDRIERGQRTYLSKKNQIITDANVKSNPLILDKFKGSHHFQVD